MAEATLNAINSAQFNAAGNVRLNCNITTPDGGIWDTDFIVNPESTPPAEPLGGLQGAAERWVAANPTQILPFSTDDPPAHNEPVNDNPPPPEPEPPPVDPDMIPETPTTPDVPDPPDIITDPPQQLTEGVDPNVEPET